MPAMVWVLFDIALISKYLTYMTLDSNKKERPYIHPSTYHSITIVSLDFRWSREQSETIHLK